MTGGYEVPLANGFPAASVSTYIGGLTARLSGHTVTGSAKLNQQ
jgi:hypothetical protein